MAPALVVAALIGLAWGAPIASRMVADGDFPFHLETAAEFASTGRISVPHFLLQVTLGALVAAGAFGSLQPTATFYFAGLYALTAALICWYIASGPSRAPSNGLPRAPSRGSRRPGAIVAAVALTPALLIAAPWLPRGTEPEPFLIGYFPPNAYHNPTMLLAKPLLILSLVAAVRTLTRHDRASAIELIAIAGVLSLTGLAKPNYLLCLVPIVAAASAWSYFRRRPVSWPRVAALCGSAAATLAATYLLYRADIGDSGVIIAPFRVMGLYTSIAPGAVLSKLAASIAFPLAVLALWPRAVAGDTRMRIVWAGAVLGVFIAYFVAEAGSTFPDGNFLWTGQMAVFLLFVASAALMREQLAQSGRLPASAARGIAALTMLALHVDSGIRHVLLKVNPGAWQTWWQ